MNEITRRTAEKTKNLYPGLIDKDRAMFLYHARILHLGELVDRFGYDLKVEEEKTYCLAHPEKAGSDGLLDDRWYGTDAELDIDKKVQVRLAKIAESQEWHFDLGFDEIDWDLLTEPTEPAKEPQFKQLSMF